MNASIEVAKSIYPKSVNHTYRGRKIRDESLKYLQSGQLTPSSQGKHVKFQSIIFQEEVQQRLREALRAIAELKRTPGREKIKFPGRCYSRSNCSCL
jgi:hypothetical protein